MPRYKFTIEYVGTNTVGWQRQLEGLSIQGAVQDAIFSMTGERPDVIGAGRTDAGVHAAGQVAHADIEKQIDIYNLIQGLNHHLRENIITEPCPISIIDAQIVDAEFNARFSATRRYYQYLIVNRPARLSLMAGRAWFVPEELDIDNMQAAANLLIGTHDFNSFRDSKCQSKTSIKSLDHIQLIQSGQLIVTNINALSFLHHQVRIIMGTLWQVGTGRLSIEGFQEVLEAKDRKQAGPTAPSDGLYLTRVDY